MCYVLAIGISYAQAPSRLKLESPGGPFSIAHFHPSVHTEFAPFFIEPGFKRLEPYAFVLTNSSDWPVQVLTIRWTMKNTEGKEYTMDVSTDNFFVNAGPVAAAGDQLLITPTAMLPQAQADSRVGFSKEMALRDAESMEAAVECTASVDTLILSNGDLYGPDLSKTLQSIEGRDRAIELILNTMQDRQELGASLRNLVASHGLQRDNPVDLWVNRLAVQILRSPDPRSMLLRLSLRTARVPVHRGLNSSK
jgi:hypothetical protein